MRWASRSAWSPTAATPPIAFARKAGIRTTPHPQPPAKAASMLDNSDRLQPLVVDTRADRSN